MLPEVNKINPFCMFSDGLRVPSQPSGGFRQETSVVSNLSFVIVNCMSSEFVTFVNTSVPV